MIFLEMGDYGSSPVICGVFFPAFTPPPIPPAVQAKSTGVLAVTGFILAFGGNLGVSDAADSTQAFMRQVKYHKAIPNARVFFAPPPKQWSKGGQSPGPSSMDWP